MENTAKATAYIRVSTTDQDVANQKHGILEYANRMGITGIEFVEDTVSSRVDWHDRKIGKIINDMRAGDILLVSEATRLGRSPLEVLEMQRDIVEKSCIVHIIKENLVIGISGKSEIEKAQQKMMLVLLGAMGEMERAFVSMRTKEALAARKAAGVVLGRPKGKQLTVRLDRRKKEIEDLLKKKVPITNIAKILNCCPTTVYEFIRRRNLNYEFEKSPRAN